MTKRKGAYYICTYPLGPGRGVLLAYTSGIFSEEDLQAAQVFLTKEASHYVPTDAANPQFVPRLHLYMTSWKNKAPLVTIRCRADAPPTFLQQFQAALLTEPRLLEHASPHPYSDPITYSVMTKNKDTVLAGLNHRGCRPIRPH